MRWLSSNRACTPGVKGRIVVVIDMSPSMFGDPTRIVEQALPKVKRVFPKLQVVTFNSASDIGLALEETASIRPERSIVMSDGYITGDEKVSRVTGMIDAVFCGNEEELNYLKRRIASPDYHAWKDYHPYMPKEHYAAGAYILWRMTRGRGVFNRFPQDADGLFDLIVYRQRRIREKRLPDRHVFHGRG